MASSSPSPSQARLPDWLAEALDVLTARRRLVVGVAVGLVVVGALVSLLLPSVLPPRPVVGVAVGIAAALLATALALALDASDLVVRGARHVRAAGGRVDVRVGRGHEDVGPLLAAVARHATDGAIRVALTPASRSAAVPGPRATALAESIARTGRRVLLTDLTRSGSPAAGLSDVVAGERSLSDVVRFEQEFHLARLAVGSDPDLAIRGFGRFAAVLPSDLEVLVVALPPLAEPGVLRAVETFDLTLVLVEVDRTERVDLIASLDAMDAAQVTSELVLIDPTTPSPAQRAAAAAPDEPDAHEPDAAEPEVVETTPEDGEPGPVTQEDEPGDEIAHPPAEATDVAEDEDATAEPVEPAEATDVAEASADEGASEPAGASADADAGAEDEVDADTAEIPVAAPSSPDGEVATDGDEVPEDRPAATGTGDAGAGEARAPDRLPAWVTEPTAPSVPVGVGAPSPDADVLEEDAAFEVARTSAALQQLAQQVWQRQGR